MYKAIIYALAAVSCLCMHAFGQDHPKSAGSAINGTNRAGATAAELPLSITILYFDQSSHQLRPGVKASLDSIARRLVGQSNLMAAITGFTDNVGKRELNIVLARYRAKIIAQYLQQHGVPATQTIVRWEGSDKKATANDSEVIETISRRAVILLYPR
jgi:outer membrane protein OmpA-like peptidoglycan-associated protein